MRIDSDTRQRCPCNRAAQGFTRPLPAIGSVVGYGISFYFLSLTLNTIPVGIAYAIWSGVGIVLISVAGWALIAAGVMVINLQAGRMIPSATSRGRSRSQHPLTVR